MVLKSSADPLQESLKNVRKHLVYYDSVEAGVCLFVVVTGQCQDVSNVV